MSATLWPQIIIAASTLLAAILGYTLAGLNEARRDRRAAERKREARDDDRKTTALLARHAFQLETLLALQDAIQLLARYAGRTMHFDHMQARKGRLTQLPPDQDDEVLANRFDVIRLRNRILDQDLRAAIDHFEGVSAAAMMDPREYEGLTGDDLERAADRREASFAAEYAAVMHELGTTLRAELAWTPDTDSTPPHR